MTAVIEAVLKQMNEQKSLEGASPASEAVKKDAVLIDKLSQSDVDSVSTNLVKELENVSLSENTKVDNDKKQVDVYNKVNLQDISGEDTLSQLSDEINAVTEEKVNTDTADTYTSSLKKEINVRQDEMRIIVVRKGDTLGKIAKRAYGNVMDYEKIYRANPEVTRPDRIYIGQKLRIPNE
jgi:LysM repeat protein